MAKRRTSQLLVGYLESVSWEVLEHHRTLIRDMIRGQSGICPLYRQDRLYYVGLASNLMGRLKQHLRDRNKGAWDRFSLYLMADDSHIKQLESLLLRIAKPSGNKVKRGFGGSENLYPQLSRVMKEQDADRQARMLEGQVASQRRRRKTATSTGTIALAGLIARRMPLRTHWRSLSGLRR